MSVSVEVITPQVPVTVTEAAIKHFRERIRLGDSHGICLRVKPSGCTGYMYHLALASEAMNDDLAIPLGDDHFLYVDRKSLPILHGTRVDYVREGLNSLLRFENPNAGDICGCGESFSVESLEIN